MKTDRITQKRRSLWAIDRQSAQLHNFRFGLVYDAASPLSVEGEYYEAKPFSERDPFVHWQFVAVDARIGTVQLIHTFLPPFRWRADMRPSSAMLNEHSISIRVRYCETDAMGCLHHSQFFNYFEQGRTELLRAQGGCYREIEEAGLFLVVVRLQCSYHSPARYDDVLTLITRVDNVSAVKIEHSYRLLRGDQLLATAASTLACVDRAGKVSRLPDSIAAT